MNQDIALISLSPALDVFIEVEEFVKGEMNPLCAKTIQAAGKAINIAQYLVQEMNEKAIITGFLGEPTKSNFQALLQDSNINDAQVYLPEMTRSNLKIYDRTHKTTTEVNMLAQFTKKKFFDQLLIKVLEIKDHCDIFVLAGSIPEGMSTSQLNLLLDLLEDKRLFIDTSKEALKLAITKKPAFLKPNIEELNEILGKSLSEDEVIQETKKIACEIDGIVCVSMGAQGSIWATPKQTLKVLPIEVKELKNTVGAGDAIMAAFIKSQKLQLNLKQTVQFCVAAATFKVKNLNIKIGQSVDDLLSFAQTVILKYL